MNNLIFLPQPRSVLPLDGAYVLAAGRFVVLAVPDPQAILFTARRIQQALQSTHSLNWGIAAGWAIPREQVGMTMRLSPAEVAHPQGYRLQILPDAITLTAHDESGLFYAVATLCQLLTQATGNSLPTLEINDWPDFPARGVMLDISRDKVPQMATLYDLVDRLASWKINQLQLYTEHTFQYTRHPEVWAEASPMTGEDILALDAYCRERYVELVPNQNSFGHMERWLKYPRYAPLAETLGEIKTPWNTIMQGPFSLAPLHPGSLELLRSLYDELLPHFSSRMFNVGCDETVDLGQGQSKAACQSRGIGRVYLDFLFKIYTDVTRRGFQMQFWGDIINDHPELVPELPKDAVGLLWGYEADHPFNIQGERFAAAHVPFYVCPGTSTWNTLAGRTDNAVANLLNAAENGLKSGACGFLNTNWGDGGHWQVYPISFVGYAAGAAFSWYLDANRQLDLPQAVGRFGFEDASGAMGKMAYDLGNVYKETRLSFPNETALYWVLQHSLEEIKSRPGIDPAVFVRLPERIAKVVLLQNAVQMARPDADLIGREYVSTVHLMEHACRRVELAFEKNLARITQLRHELKADLTEFLAEYQSLWLVRNRPGGLPQSKTRFEAMIRDY